MSVDVRAATRCEQCGQVDDHPKIHVQVNGVIRTTHHDCLDADAEAMVRNSLADPAGVHPADIIDLAKAGVHGADLVEAIAELAAASGQEAGE